MRNMFSVLILTILTLCVISCAGGNAVIPEATIDALEPSNYPTQSQEPYRQFLGYYEIEISGESAIITPLRGATLHFNAVRLLEVEPCGSCLTVDNITHYPPDEVEADFKIRHPFPGQLKFTGFDVRGIFISDANYLMPVSDRSFAWGSSEPRVLNPDGYTSLFNPTEFPPDSPTWPVLKYWPGGFSPITDLNSRLNPFLAFSKEAPRRMFLPGAVKTRTVRLRGGYVEPMKFGYAVDACWYPVDGDVTDPENDFPLAANASEAYELSITVTQGIGPTQHTISDVWLDVYDWQGPHSLSTVSIESPQFFDGEKVLEFAEARPDGALRYGGDIRNIKGQGAGEYPVQFRVTDTETDANLGVVDAYNIESVETVNKNGWARSWGPGKGLSVGVDSQDYVYVVGQYGETVDFDPGTGIVNAGTGNSFPPSGACLIKYGPSGDMVWVRGWGRSGVYGICKPWSIDVDGSGNIYVCGEFKGTVDFDPGPGEDYKTSTSWDESDVYLVKYTTDGQYHWSRTWGGEYSNWLGSWDDIGECVKVNPGGMVTVAGHFTGEVDFDPGPGEHIVYCVRNHQFLSRFTPDGDWVWTRTWGNFYTGKGIDMEIDTEEKIFITGNWEGTLDFDPGPDEYVLSTFDHDSEGYLTCFTSDGEFEWVKTWLGDNEINPYLRTAGLALDPMQNVIILGNFKGPKDFDPGPGEFFLGALGDMQVFMVSLNNDGIFNWAISLNIAENNDNITTAYAIASDIYGNLGLVTLAEGVIDLDPGDGNVIVDAGELSTLVVKFNPQGSYLGNSMFAGNLHQRAIYNISNESLVSDQFGDAYLTGTFRGTVDLDPGFNAQRHYTDGRYHACLVKIPASGEW